MSQSVSRVIAAYAPLPLHHQSIHFCILFLYIYFFYIYARMCVYNHTIQQRMFSGGPIGCHIFVNFFESSFFCPGNVTASAGVGKGRVVFFLTFWHLQKITNCHCLAAHPRQPSCCNWWAANCAAFAAEASVADVMRNKKSDCTPHCSWLTESVCACVCFQLSFWSQLGSAATVLSYRRIGDCRRRLA